MDAAEKTLATLQKIASAPNADEYRVGATHASAVLKLAVGLGQVLGLRAIYPLPAAFSAGVAARRSKRIRDTRLAQPMRHYLGATLLQAGEAEKAAVYRRDLRRIK